MGTVTKQFKSEIKQLPFILGKLIGGIMAVIGFPGIVIIITRKPDPSWAGILPFLLAGISGIGIFVLSSQMLGRRMRENAEATPAPKDQKRTSMISWSILLALAAIFLSAVYIMTLTNK